MSKKHAGEGPHGFLLLDKPAGLTSHDVVARVRYHLNTRKVGHAGTLDPAATGLLLLGVGYARERYCRPHGRYRAGSERRERD